MEKSEEKSAEQSGTKTFWQKYRRLILISFGIYVLLSLIILYFAAGPQNQPFVYQTF